MLDIVNNVNMSACPVTLYNLNKKVLSIPNIDLKISLHTLSKCS